MYVCTRMYIDIVCIHTIYKSIFIYIYIYMCIRDMVNVYNKLIVNVVIKLNYDASLTTSDMYSFWTIALVWCDPEVVGRCLRPSRSDCGEIKRLDGNQPARLHFYSNLRPSPIFIRALQPFASFTPLFARDSCLSDVSSITNSSRRDRDRERERKREGRSRDSV